MCRNYKFRICGVRIANSHQRVNLEVVHLAQAKNYVMAYDFARGLLINFGAISLQYKLIFNPKFNAPTNLDNPLNN